MFDPSKSYKVIWNGVEYICDEVIDISDDDGPAYMIGNGADMELEDNGMPFMMFTADWWEEKTFYVFDYASSSEWDNASAINTFSVEEIENNVSSVYKCTLEKTIQGDTPMTFLKGLPLNIAKNKSVTVEINGNHYTTQYLDGDTGFLNVDGSMIATRIYLNLKDLANLCTETMVFYHHTDIDVDGVNLVLFGTHTGYIELSKTEWSFQE